MASASRISSYNYKAHRVHLTWCFRAAAGALVPEVISASGGRALLQARGL